MLGHHEPVQRVVVEVPRTHDRISIALKVPYAVIATGWNRIAVNRGGCACALRIRSAIELAAEHTHRSPRRTRRKRATPEDGGLAVRLDSKQPNDFEFLQRITLKQVRF